MSDLRDDQLRAAMFAALGRLVRRWSFDVPYVGGLDAGFSFDGKTVPFLSKHKGIFHAAAQRGKSALSVMTSVRSPYGDAPADEGFWYAYRAGDPDQYDNRALRLAVQLRTPIAYFVGTRTGWFEPLFPCYAVEDDHLGRRVRLDVGTLEPSGVSTLGTDVVERRYANRVVRSRLHQARFRGAVVSAYDTRCAICRLDRVQLLDATHIAPDAADDDTAAVTNGISMCAIHHRAFDDHLVGVTPEYRVEVSRRLLEVEDGPMLEV